MFGKKGGKKKSGASSGLTVLTRGTVFEGELVSEGDIRIDGSVSGKIDCRAAVIIGREGSVEGEVSTVDMRVAGSFRGNADVKGELHLEPSASVDGELVVSALDVEDGAKLNGRVLMKQEGAPGGGVHEEVVPETDR